MAIYLVGDIQGCYQEFKALLAQVGFNKEKDQLYIAGDMVARGPDSLATLRFIKSLGTSAKIVLGNHDLHLLSVYAGLKRAKPQDKLDKLLTSPDIDELMQWLAQQPLLQQINNENAYMSHAGISPQWSLHEAIKQAHSAHEKLSSDNRNHWLEIMYGENPNNWQQAQSDEDKFRYTINAFTRMRFCDENKHLEFKEKLSPASLPYEKRLPGQKLQPWYDMSATINDTVWVFGHWAALMGECPKDKVYALDTGCVWGNHLTILRWHDKKLFTEPAR